MLTLPFSHLQSRGEVATAGVLLTGGVQLSQELAFSYVENVPGPQTSHVKPKHRTNPGAHRACQTHCPPGVSGPPTCESAI